MDSLRLHDTGAGVEDIQGKLASLGFLDDGKVTGTFDKATASAVAAFCKDRGLPESDEVNEHVWAALLDATFRMGDRTLYLRMPHYHGADVLQLQQALAALGFATGDEDGIFGAYTELALRNFQMNMGLPTDGIAGAFTYAAIANLHHSWEGKQGPADSSYLGFARAADVLEANTLCLFGTCDFTRSVASRMSNLALATNPASKIMSADSLLVAPDASMLMVHIVLDKQEAAEGTPFVTFDDESTLALRLGSAIGATKKVPPRIAVSLPGRQWEDAGVGRSAQHFAISLLDALCAALASQNQS